MKIVHYPHPSLRHKARPLLSVDKSVHLQIGQMLDLMYEAKGVGLAGPQVIFPYQVMVINLTSDPNQREHEGVYLNPTILDRQGSVEAEEGCLSLPGLYQKVRRARTVKVQAYDLKGVLVEKTLNDLEARVWQHETDHLHGILFIDKVGPIGKLAIRGSIKDFEREYRRAQERGEIPPNAEIEKHLAGQALAS